MVAKASVRYRQPSYNLLYHHVRSCRDLLRRLVLDRMLDINGVKARAPQRTGLDSRGSGELGCGHGHCRNTQVFQSNRVVQTARCARPSIRQPFHHRIHRAQLFDDLRRRVF